MATPSIIYCDESGNDGPNYLNPKSPFYVLAGWIVPEDKILDASLEMERLRSTHCREAIELGFSTFKGKPWAVSESMTRLGTMGLVPMYVLAEKRFCIAAKIVETFLDPYFNPALHVQFSSDFITKQELANTLYERLSDAALRRFAEAYRAPSQLKLEQALEEIALECKGSVNPETTELLFGSKPRLAEIAEAEIGAVKIWGKAIGTLNAPCLISFLMLIEELGQQGYFRPKKVVHDEQGPYQEDYQRLFLQFKGAKEVRIQMNGMQVPFGAIRVIEDFEVQRSVDQPLIQAADLLAGSIGHLATSLIRGRVLHRQEIELGGLLFPAMLQKEILLTNVICSTRMFGKIGEAIRIAYPSVSDHEPKTSEESEIKWKSTLPEGELEVLPALRGERSSQEKPAISIKFTLPIFSIASVAKNELRVLFPPGKAFGETTDVERCLPIWTRRDLADSFLNKNDWTEPHYVIEFGAKEIPDFVERIRAISEWTAYVRMNLFEEEAKYPYPILRLADDLERIWARIQRVGANGLLDAVFKHHEIGGQVIQSLLLSSGEYIAIRPTDGMRAEGRTRDEAVARLTSLIQN